MSRWTETVFELPRKMEKLLATLATYSASNGKPIIQSVLVNSRHHVEEGASYDNWNGGTYGHALHFQVAAPVYYEIIDSLEALSKEIAEGLNHLSTVENEFIDGVFLEPQDDPNLENWRERSGALVQSTTAANTASDDHLARIWESDYFRLFLTHKADHKQRASQFKVAMEYYGVSCFVAHEDIEPTKEWQAEIERALFSMDALVALLTEDFADSRWTDQEVGVAFGRQVPIIPIRLGTDPYGFIGKYQAVNGGTKTQRKLAKEVYDLMWSKPDLVPPLTAGLVARFEDSKNYDQSNTLMQILMERVKTAPPDLIERLEQAPEKNRQVRESNAVKSGLPGLVRRLRG